MIKKKYYTIAQMAEICNLTAHTIRYYDKEGLLPFIERTPSGIRHFKDEDIEAFAIINCLKETGLGIKEIKTFMDWCKQGDETIEERLNLFLEQKKKVEAQMKELKKHLKKIDFKIQYYQTAKEAGTLAVHEKLNCPIKQKKSGFKTLLKFKK